MNPTIVKLALAALLGRKRFLLLLLFPGALVALTLLIRVLSSRPEDATSVLFGVGTSLVLPLLALVAATAVMGPEVDDGSLVYLLAKPVSRYAVAASKYVVALATVLVLGPVLLWVVGAAVDPDDLATRPPGRWARQRPQRRTRRSSWRSARSGSTRWSPGSSWCCCGRAPSPTSSPALRG